MSTEITTREGRAEVATLPPAFVEKYPALDVDVDIQELLAETMGPGGDLNLGNLTRIKVPPAEFKSWMVPDDDGESVPAKTVTGVPVALISRRSMWHSDVPSGSAPDCRSNDLEHGVGAFGEGSERNPTGLCTDCPMAVRGSANKGTQASKCKEQRVIFLLTGDLLPVMVVIPPGSLPNFKSFAAFLFKKAVRGVKRGDGSVSSAWLRLEVELGLERDTNPAGQEYNKTTFKIARRLEPVEVERVSAYGQWVDGLIAAQEDAIGEIIEGGDAPPSVDVPFDAAGLPVDEVDLNGATAGGRAKGR